MSESGIGYCIAVEKLFWGISAKRNIIVKVVSQDITVLHGDKHLGFLSIIERRRNFACTVLWHLEIGHKTTL